jgi:plastocyanin
MAGGVPRSSLLGISVATHRQRVDSRSCRTHIGFKQAQTRTVAVGTTVVWQNDDEIPHTITSVDGTFHSPALDTKDKFSFTFDKAGMFEYLCACIRV